MGDDMDFRALYFTTEGRIGRQQWWIGAIILGVASALVSFLVLPLVGLGGPDMARIMAAANDPAAVGALITSSMQTAAWGSLILILVTAYPMYCLSVKRRHDRNNNGMDIIAYLALAVVLILLQALGLGFTSTDIGGVVVPTPTGLYSIVGAISGIFAIYLLVVLGFLKGTTGDNAYGPDPLLGKA
jgi:uncharacterized membrane protein YhaH (DUF805 family)